MGQAEKKCVSLFESMNSEFRIVCSFTFLKLSWVCGQMSRPSPSILKWAKKKGEGKWTIQASKLFFFAKLECEKIFFCFCPFVQTISFFLSFYSRIPSFFLCILVLHKLHKLHSYWWICKLLKEKLISISWNLLVSKSE